MQDTEIVLSDNEIHMLNALASRARERAQAVESLLEGVELSYAQGLSALGYLCAKGLAQSEVIGSELKRVLRKAGQEYLEQELPEQRLWHYLLEKGSLTLQEINAYLPQSEAKFTIGMYLGAFQKAGYVAFNSGTLTARQREMPASMAQLQAYLAHVKETEQRDPGNPAESEAERRKLVEDRQISLPGYRLTAAGEARARLLAEEAMQDRIGSVTRDMLLSGAWRGRQFRPLSVVAPPEKRLELQHPLPRFLGYLRSALVAAGFKEVSRPILETQFWNLNVLFMQKCHPVRSPRHLLAIEGVRLPEESAAMSEATRTCQERFALDYQGKGASGSRGWGNLEGFNNDQVVVRSHSTPVTVRQLATAQAYPVRVFGFSRCCRARPEKPEFLQMDVLVADAGLNVSTLLGTIKHVCLAMFPRAVDVRVQANYFPFAEVSVDIFVVYADGSSDEIGSCGLLRPESATILNVPVPVGLIGFNVSRLAKFLCDHEKAFDPNSFGFDAFDETEVPVYAER